MHLLEQILHNCIFFDQLKINQVGSLSIHFNNLSEYIFLILTFYQPDFGILKESNLQK
jgi:hypothetical protein